MSQTFHIWLLCRVESPAGCKQLQSETISHSSWAHLQRPCRWAADRQQTLTRGNIDELLPVSPRRSVYRPSKDDQRRLQTWHWPSFVSHGRDSGWPLRLREFRISILIFFPPSFLALFFFLRSTHLFFLQLNMRGTARVGANVQAIHLFRTSDPITFQRSEPNLRPDGSATTSDSCAHYITATSTFFRFLLQQLASSSSQVSHQNPLNLWQNNWLVAWNARSTVSKY